MARNILLCCALITTLGAATACSQQFIPETSSNSGSQNTSNTQTAMPGTTAANSGLSAPIVAPPSYNNRPLEPGQLPQAQTMPNGLPALSPLKGVNVDTLFAENITNTDRRFERLENAVTDMRREFEAVKPAIVRLVAVEDDIQNMVEQLEIMATQETSTSAAPAPIYAQPATPYEAPQELRPVDLSPPPSPQTNESGTMQPAPHVEPKPQTAAPSPTSTVTTSNDPTVTNLRTGQHSDKIRLVLDMSKKVPYSVDLDANENILLIELPDAKWIGATSKNLGATPVIASYSVEAMNEEKGTRIIIPLKKASKILETALLPPGGDNSNYRIYVDLKL